MDNRYRRGSNASLTISVKSEKANVKKRKSFPGKAGSAMKTCLIVLDGEINKSLLRKFISKSEAKPVLVAADGASNKLYQWKIIPHYIIGDLDSISRKALALFKKKNVKIKKITEQEHNDFEKCIKLALSKKIKDVTVIGFGGGRADHFLNNFSVMKRYYKKCNVKLADNEFEIFFSGKFAEIDCRIGDTVSLMAMPKAAGITTTGLKYPLRNESLEFGVREGALNRATRSKVRIIVKKGDLLVFKKN